MQPRVAEVADAVLVAAARGQVVEAEREVEPLARPGPRGRRGAHDARRGVLERDLVRVRVMVTVRVRVRVRVWVRARARARARVRVRVRRRPPARCSWPSAGSCWGPLRG